MNLEIIIGGFEMNAQKTLDKGLKEKKTSRLFANLQWPTDNLEKLFGIMWIDWLMPCFCIAITTMFIVCDLTKYHCDGQAMTKQPYQFFGLAAIAILLSFVPMVIHKHDDKQNVLEHFENCQHVVLTITNEIFLPNGFIVDIIGTTDRVMLCDMCEVALITIDQNIKWPTKDISPVAMTREIEKLHTNTIRFHKMNLINEKTAKEYLPENKWELLKI